jgi:hypothetical protein
MDHEQSREESSDEEPQQEIQGEVAASREQRMHPVSS